jgi:uncharacterized cupredoxin-like copper-binding protein
MTVDAPRKTVSALARIGSLAAVAVLAVACSSSSSSPAASSAGSPAAGATDVSAALSEFKIDLGANSAAAGSVSFDLKNDGTTTHEFVVFRTDLAPDKLPLSEDGTEVDEEGEGITAVDEVEDLEPGTTGNLTVDLPAGHYVLICNLPAHYTSGMHAEFTTQ